MEKLSKKGIKTIDDLLQYGLENFKTELLDEWNNVLFYDWTINHESKSLLNYKNPLFWQGIKTRDSAYRKVLKRLSEFTENHSDTIQHSISKLIEKKVTELCEKGTGIDQEKSNESYTIKKKEGAKIDQVKLRNYDIKKTARGTEIDSLYIRSILNPTGERKCVITRHDISMQKDDSFLLSHEGLKYLYENDKRAYDEVVKKYLSEYWQNATISMQIKETSHNIRNAFNNLKNRQGIIYPSNQYSLF